MVVRLRLDGVAVRRIESCDPHLLGRLLLEHDARLAPPGALAEGAVGEDLESGDVGDALNGLFYLGVDLEDSFDGSVDGYFEGYSHPDSI